jgi:hypothetical protein
MKRNHVINRLVEIGRNKKALSKLTNEELLELMKKEATRLEALAKAKAEREARIMLFAARRARRQQREDRERREAFEAEQFRLQRIRKPLPRIAPDPLTLARLKAISEAKRLRDQSKEAAHRFRETGDRAWADRASMLLQGARNLEEALSENS